MAKPRCLYEVLGVSRDATADEIRCSFRHLALQIHPDKQADSGLSTADATAAFHELFEAYKVLSVAKERDWYDNHRSDLRSGNSFSRSSHLSRASILDLSSFFVSSCFSGYSDSGKGFFKVYGDVFSEIHSQELYFARNLGLGLDPAPPIGNVYSPYAEFMAFYNYWLGFSTVIDFDWVDEDYREEEMNSRNWMVRDLVVFVKKMDKRLVDIRGREREEDEKIREKARVKKKEKVKRRREENLKFGKLNKNQNPQKQKEDDDDDDEVVHEKEKVMKDEKKKTKKKENVTDKMKRRAKRKAKRMEKKMEKEEMMKKFQSVICKEIDEDDDDGDEKKKNKFWLMNMKKKKKNNDSSKRNKVWRMVMYEGVEDEGDDDMVEEEKKEKGFGRVYCKECKQYFRFHEHIKKKGSSKKVVRRDKWDASKPLILVFQSVVEATPRKSYQYRFFDKHI